MSSLLAVLIVGTSSLGSHLIYSYPPSPQPVPRTSRPIYSTRSSRAKAPAKPAMYDSGSNDNSEDDTSPSSSDDDDDDAGELFGQGHHPRRGSAEGEREGGGILDNFLGFPNPTLAGLLSPNRELCDQPFELVVDHLAFVGHPVWLGEDTHQPEAGPAEEAEQRGRKGQPTSTPQDLQRTFSQFSLSHSRDHSPAEPSVPPSEPGSGPPSPSHELSSPIDQPVSPSSTATLFPGATSMASSHQSHGSVHGSGRLTSFNFVCVIDTPPDGHLSSHLESWYNDVVIPLTANVKALERKTKWLGKEAAKLRRAREKAHEKGISPNALLASLPSTSSLAAAFSHLYASLKTQQSAYFKLDALPVQVRLRGEAPLEDNSSFLDTLHEDGFRIAQQDDEETSRSKSPTGERTRRVRHAPLFSRERRKAKVRFMAWETLLPLDDPEEMIEAVEEGTLLWRFLDICSPTLSFAEYETLLDLEPEDSPLQEIVEHLVHWGKAKLMDVVSLKNNYLIATGLDGALLAGLTRKFGLAFPRLQPLPVLLAALRPGEAFASLCAVPSLRSTYFGALVWLLQHDVVEKQRTFLRLVATEDIKQSAAAHWSETGGAQGTSSSALSSSVASDRSASGRSQRSAKASVEDAKAMAIVGSGLSGSPPLSRSAAALKFAAASGRRRTSSLNPANAAPKPKLASANGTYSSASDRPEEVTKGPSIIPDPGRPTSHESRWLKEMERDKQASDVDKFRRVRRMMDGHSHLDEVRHRAGLTRKELRTVLVAFEEFVVGFSHP